MFIKVLISENHSNVLSASKEKRFGENSSSIRTSYELTQLIKDGNYSEKEILDKNNEEGDKKEYKTTTFNLSAEALRILDEFTAKTHLSRAEIIRAIILIREDEMNGTRTVSTSTITSSSLSKTESINTIISKVFHNFNDRGEFSPVMDVLSYWADDTAKSLEDPSNSPILAGFYANLGWSNFRSFDVINSLYKLFLCYCAVHDTNPNRPLYMIKGDEVFLDRASARVKQPEYISNIKKSFFAKNYIDYIKGDAKNIGNRHADRLEIYENLVDDAELNELATVTYTLANFSPCPDDNFNAMKGIIASDSLSWFVDILQSGAEQPETLAPYNKILEKSGFILTQSACIEYVDWLKANRTKAFLEDYFYVKDGKIFGIPQFPNQSLTHTIPANEFELSCYIQNTISRINARALRMIKYISSK